jgi:preprotein translocase subunit SecA
VRGERPERAEREDPFVARTVRQVVGCLCLPRHASRRRLAKWAARVDLQSRGLSELSETGFDEAVAELRRKLLRAGLAEVLLPRGFALVREAARRALGTPHYDVQLFGGWVMARSGLAELETGEGKTLTATLPASLAALAGIPVHVITANDYLVERDAEAMSPLYERLGMRVGVVVEGQPDRVARREAYACDVTYATNKQVSFDYLRDLIAAGKDRRLAQRLRLDGVQTHSAQTAPVMRGLCFGIIDEADSVLIDDARTPLLLSGEGAPADEETVRKALILSEQLDEGPDFSVDRLRGEIELTLRGRSRLDELGHFVEGPLAGERRREEWVHRALCVDHLYERDLHYLVSDGKIEIIDLPTGRRAPDRSFEGGMQSLIEAREGLALTPQRETLARISYQRFFRRYLRLAGMTGTAREASRELWNVYGLRTVIVPTRLPSRRSALGRRVLPSAEAKWDAVVARVAELQGEGRPVLVGTSALATSEVLSELLDQAGLTHEVLSARQDQEEAAVVARAGQPSCITVATRMAGRGTDVKLGKGVPEIGGLAVVSTELGEARRIDRQLFGRCGRQGAPGSYEQIVSLEDRLLEVHRNGWRGLVTGNPTLLRLLGSLLPVAAQRAEERRSAMARRRLLESERVLRQLLAFSGGGT